MLNRDVVIKEVARLLRESELTGDAQLFVDIDKELQTHGFVLSAIQHGILGTRLTVEKVDGKNHTLSPAD